MKISFFFSETSHKQEIWVCGPQQKVAKTKSGEKGHNKVRSRKNLFKEKRERGVALPPKEYAATPHSAFAEKSKTSPRWEQQGEAGQGLFYGNT